MITKLTPGKAALYILDIFIHEFEGRPDRTISFTAFLAVWNIRELPVKAFNHGMEFAARAGWVDILDVRASYRLTRAGYDKVSPPSAAKKL